LEIDVRVREEKFLVLVGRVKDFENGIFISNLFSKSFRRAYYESLIR
jgi:hypothetical protein